ncbi:MAG: LPS-assembly lipoprotein LptE [Gammaproteobacteria bacterium]
MFNYQLSDRTNRAAKPAAAAFLALLLTACGFHMRGTMLLPEAMQNIYLENASSTLATEVKKTLKFSNAKIVSSKQSAGVIIKIVNEQFRTISLSISSHGKTNEFELFYSLDFEILDAEGKILQPKKNMIITRSYFNDQTQVLAKGNEATLLRQQIYQQAGSNLVDRAGAALESAKTDRAL